MRNWLKELDRHVRQHKVKEHLQLMLELAENHKSDWEAVASCKDNGCSTTFAQVLRQVIKMNGSQLLLVEELLVKLLRRVIETVTDDFMLQRFGRKTLLKAVMGVLLHTHASIQLRKCCALFMLNVLHAKRCADETMAFINEKEARSMLYKLVSVLGSPNKGFASMALQDMLLEIAVRVRMRLKKMKMKTDELQLIQQFPTHLRVPFQELTPSKNYDANSRALLKLINADNPFVFSPVVQEAFCDQRPFEITKLDLGLTAELGYALEDAQEHEDAEKSFSFEYGRLSDVTFSNEPGGRTLSFCVDNADHTLKCGLALSEHFCLTFHLATPEDLIKLKAFLGNSLKPEQYAKKRERASIATSLAPWKMETSNQQPLLSRLLQAQEDGDKAGMHVDPNAEIPNAELPPTSQLQVTRPLKSLFKKLPVAPEPNSPSKQSSSRTTSLERCALQEFGAEEPPPRKKNADLRGKAVTSPTPPARPLADPIVSARKESRRESTAKESPAIKDRGLASARKDQAMGKQADKSPSQPTVKPLQRHTNSASRRKTRGNQQDDDENVNENRQGEHAPPPPKQKAAPSQQASKPKVHHSQTQDDMITPVEKPTQSAVLTDTASSGKKKQSGKVALFGISATYEKFEKERPPEVMSEVTLPSTLQGPHHVVRPSISPRRLSTQQRPHGSTPRERIKAERDATEEKVSQAKEKKARQSRVKEEDPIEEADVDMDVEMDDADGNDSLASDSAQMLLLKNVKKLIEQKRKRSREEEQHEKEQRAKLAKLAKLQSKLHTNACQLAEEIELQEARVKELRCLASVLREDSVNIERFIRDMVTESKPKRRM